MSRDEALELYDSLRAKGWLFKSYYKYNFSFVSKADPIVSVSLGGMADDIYREEVYPEMNFNDYDLDYFNGIYVQVDSETIRSYDPSHDSGAW